MSIAEIQNGLSTIAEKLGIDLILLFGSRADGSNRKDSDFDIAYRSKKPLDSDSGVFQAVMDYTGSDNLHILDLRPVQPLTLFEVLNNCKVLYAENMADFYNLRCYAMKRYYDEVKPLFQLKFDRLKAQYLI